MRSKRARANSLPVSTQFPRPPSKCERSVSDVSPIAAARVRIAYSDDTLCESSLANMHRLVRAAQDGGAASGTSAALARKALQYRKKLESAQAADLNDPTFDIATFMGVTWCKVVPQE